MKNVHLLPENVINKIAAGEVIERTASVVKEILENSIDAGATDIQLHLQDGGKSSITIKDNGSGIEKDDLHDIFLRHATSKIQTDKDLYNISSLGFRGEALYSIAAIADVSLDSKTANSDSGWHIRIRGGEQADIKPSAMPNTGTTITIKDLFFNIPARRKFLKSNTAELNQILNIAIPYTLLYPERKFLITHHNKTLIDVEPTNNYKQRIAKILNINEEHLLEASAQWDFEDIFDQEEDNKTNNNWKAHIILGDINIKRHRRDLQFLFINGRPIEHKNINFLINQTYRLILPDKQFAAFIIFLTIPKHKIDVNIHPTKREVKIRNEKDLASALRHLCEKTLMNAPQTKKAAEEKPLFAFENTVPKQTYTPQKIPIPSSKQSYSIPKTSTPYTPTESFQPSKNQNIPLFEDMQKPHPSLRNRVQQSRYIGAFNNKYLLFEHKDTLFVMDQHAAQERIKYEAILNQINKGHIEEQLLISPILVKLLPQEIISWKETADKLKEIGFQSIQHDDTTIAIKSYPRIIKDIEKTFKQLISEDTANSINYDVIAQRACKESVKAGDSLSKEEAIALKEQLICSIDPFTCPHGRPIVVEFDEKFLDRQFMRG